MPTLCAMVCPCHTVAMESDLLPAGAMDGAEAGYYGRFVCLQTAPAGRCW